MTKRVCIAPGHGGFDSGAVANGLEEKNLNLAVSLKLESLLKAAGVEVVMTRTTDEAAGGATDVMGDLTHECLIANEAHADLFFCVHTNAGGGNGAEAYVYPRSDVFQLAKQCVTSLGEYVGIHGEPVKYDQNLWVLAHTQMPAILVEIGFIDSTDSKKLTDTDKIAQLLYEPLVKWLGGKVEEPAPSAPQAPESAPQTNGEGNPSGDAPATPETGAQAPSVPSVPTSAPALTMDDVQQAISDAMSQLPATLSADDVKTIAESAVSAAFAKAAASING